MLRYSLACFSFVFRSLRSRYLQFIESCHQLNDVENFGTLVNRAKTIGFEISKVVFRGYLASPTLQGLHDSSVENRTKLKLEVGGNLIVVGIRLESNLNFFRFIS